MLNTYTLTDSERIDLINKLSLLIKYIREDNSIKYFIHIIEFTFFYSKKLFYYKKILTFSTTH